MSDPALRLRAVPTISDVPAPFWDACANPGGMIASALPDGAMANEARTAHENSEAPLQVLKVSSQCDAGRKSAINAAYNPFVAHDYLSALEVSESAIAMTGWQPQHLLAEAADGTLLGAVPCYLKSHSRGEYVFDHGWAEAYERAGGNYYPKLQVSVPFTPATGPRLLVRPGPGAAAVRAALAAGLVALCQRREASSVHVTFVPKDDWRLLADRGFLQRTDQQFHWHNAGYDNFSAFLNALASRKRKTVRRERREALENGITVHWLTGTDLTEEIWDVFFAFYINTGSRKWGRPYLTRAFFSLIGETLRDRILLVMAKRAGRWIAGAINFIGSDALYGRHWGALEEHPFLHFELCYYQAIEFAIARGLTRVEAGAQGEHKLARGYVPATTYSAHYVADPALRRAIAEYLSRERAYVDAAGEELAALAPFRKTHV
ncbi:MAG: N-acetyltransferase [Rhizobiales bacterium]|nr:N-acetyltransferase [Hyphomicrobiales bacterium]